MFTPTCWFGIEEAFRPNSRGDAAAGLLSKGREAHARGVHARLPHVHLVLPLLRGEAVVPLGFGLEYTYVSNSFRVVGANYLVVYVTKTWMLDWGTSITFGYGHTGNEEQTSF